MLRKIILIIGLTIIIGLCACGNNDEKYLGTYYFTSLSCKTPEGTESVEKEYYSDILFNDSVIKLESDGVCWVGVGVPNIELTYTVEGDIISLSDGSSYQFNEDKKTLTQILTGEGFTTTIIFKQRV